MKENISFEKALKALKSGRRVARKGWNGKDMFVYMARGCIARSSYIPEISRLPKSVLKFLEKRNGEIPVLPHLCMWTVRGESLTGWSATQTDMLMEDWYILNENS